MGSGSSKKQLQKDIEAKNDLIDIHQKEIKKLKSDKATDLEKDKKETEKRIRELEESILRIQAEKDSLLSNAIVRRRLELQKQERIEEVSYDDFVGFDYALDMVDLVYDMASESGTGILGFGPGGTGKTMIAKYFVSCENYSYIEVSEDSVVGKDDGECAELLRMTFAEARRRKPCIVLFDEMDKILSRTASRTPTLVGVLNKEMDGLKTGTKHKNIIFVATTNKPADIDDAVHQRFPFHWYFPLPNRAYRYMMFYKRLVSSRSTCDGGSLYDFADATKGYSFRELNNVLKLAFKAQKRAQAREVTRDMVMLAIQAIPPTTSIETIDANKSYARHHGANVFGRDVEEN